MMRGNRRGKGVAGRLQALSGGASVLAMVAAGLVATPESAWTQVKPGDPQCPASGQTVTCSGDLSEGVDVTPRDNFDTLLIENVAGNIDASTADGVAIDFRNNFKPVTINIDAPDTTITSEGKSFPRPPYVVGSSQAAGIRAVSRSDVSIYSNTDIVIDSSAVDTSQADITAGILVEPVAYDQDVTRKVSIVNDGNIELLPGKETFYKSGIYVGRTASLGLFPLPDDFDIPVGTVAVTNNGNITVNRGDGITLDELTRGNVDIVNAGTIDIIGGSLTAGISYDAYASSTLNVRNSGEIRIWDDADTRFPIGMWIRPGGDGGGSDPSFHRPVTVINDGTIAHQKDRSPDASSIGIWVSAHSARIGAGRAAGFDNATLTVINNGTIDVRDIGIAAEYSGNTTIENHGDIIVEGLKNEAVGVEFNFRWSGNDAAFNPIGNDVFFTNSQDARIIVGDSAATADPDNLRHPTGVELLGSPVAVNHGLIRALGENANGFLASAGYLMFSSMEYPAEIGQVDITNTGTVEALGLNATGFSVYRAYGEPSDVYDTIIVNQGIIQATGPGADAIRFEHTVLSTADPKLANEGNATITLGDGSRVIGGGGVGIRFIAGGEHTITNAGFLTADSGKAIVGGTAKETVINSGKIEGSVSLGEGTDTMELVAVAGQSVAGPIDGGDGKDTFRLSGAGKASLGMDTVTAFEAFQKTDASTWTLTGTNADTASFSVDEGTLVNNADLQSMQMTVASQGRLAGIGTVGDLTIDGTVAPGNSIGTINVAGNVTFNTGSTYEVELEAPDKSDRIAVTGTATINGGEVVVTKLSAEADYKGGQSYRIIEADGGVVKNAGFTYDNPFLFLSSELEYGTNSVDIALLAGAEPDKEFQSVARTHNQFQSAMALNDLGTTGDELTVFNQLALMTDADEARRAFDLASGEIHASGQHVIDQSFSQFSRTLRHRAGAGIGSVGATAGTQVYTAPLAYGPLTTVSAGIEAIDAATVSADRRIANAWFAPLGGGGTIDADGNAGKLDWWTGGFAGGYEGSLDVSAGNAWAGFGLGYMRGNGSVNARRSTIDADNFQLGIYGGWTDGPWTLTGSFAYAASNIDTERKIAFGGIDRTARADYWAHSVGLSGEAAYAFALGTGTVLSPLATLDAGWSGHGGFTETGAGALNLSGSSESWTRLDTGLGLAVAHTVPVENGNLTLEARALWEHAFADVTPGQSLAFAGSPTGFEVLGPDAGRDRLRIGAGLAYRMANDMTLTARYDGLFSSDERSHTAAVGFNFKF